MKLFGRKHKNDEKPGINEDIYDKKAWIGIDWLVKFSKNNPFNRPAAGHDSGYANKMYKGGRKFVDKLFKERMEAYEWLYGNKKEHKWMRRLFGSTVGAVGWVFYYT